MATKSRAEGKPRIILGTMNIGPDSSNGARITSLDEYNSILDKFQSLGYNEIDTARVYVGGEQESFTRRANWKARGLSCATKWYPYSHGDHAAAKVEAALEKSLAELGTASVDVFYLHAADRGTPFQETLAKADELHRRGKFRQLGLSNYTAYEVAEVALLCRHHGYLPPTIYQAMYNAITRAIEPELVAACRRYGLDLVVYNPTAGGIFSGRYRSKDVIPAEGRYSDNHGWAGAVVRERYFRDANFEALRILEAAAQKADLTLLEIAFRWLVHHSALKVVDGNDGVVIGISSEAQLEQNIRDLEKGPLPDEVVEALDRAWLVAKATVTPYWHGDLDYSYDTKAALATL